MKVLIFHQFYTRLDEPGIQRFNVFAPYWKEKGIETTVIAGDVNYMTGKKYQKRDGQSRDFWDGGVVRLKRVFTSSFGFSYRSFVGRIFTYLTFVYSAFIAGFFEKKPSVIIASSPPIFLALVGWAVARLKKAKFIFEVRDLWPDEIIELGGLKNKFLIKISYAVEKFLYERANAIVVNSPGLKDFLTISKKIEPDKIAIIQNPVNLDIVTDEATMSGLTEKLGWKNKIVVLYSGSFSTVYDFDLIIDTARRLQEEAPNLLFVFIGDGKQKPRIMERVKNEEIRNVQFLKPMPKYELLNYMTTADIGIASLGKMGLLKHVYATKVLDYMMAKKPVVVAMEGVTRDLVCEEAKCGICVEPGDAKGIKNAILEIAGRKDLQEKFGENGYRCVKENFNGENLAGRYLELLN